MKLSIDHLFVTLAIAILTTPQAFGAALELTAPAQVGMSTDRIGRLDEALASYVERGQLAGSVTLVARHGKIVYLQAFGDRDRESGSPMATDSMFRIASQTKAIVSAGVMILAEQGQLLPTDPVGKYLPEFMETSVSVPRADGGYDIVRASRTITIHDLLTHTSGFSYGEGVAADRWRDAELQSWYFADKSESIRESVARMAALPADAHPGEQWIYGYNTDILGALIEVASGQPLDEYLNERIFEPLGMSDTHFYLPRRKTDRLATVYSMEDGELRRAPDNGRVGQGAYAQGPQTSFSGGAGLVSTATDYAKFLQMMLNGGELDDVRILGRKTVELMTVDHLDDIEFRKGVGFGLGFSVVKDLGARGTPGSVGEFGWGGAYHSTYWVDPNESLVVVHLTQLIPAADVDDHDKVRALVYQSIID